MQSPKGKGRTAPSLRVVVATLRKHYGPPSAPIARTAWEMIVWEAIAYLADDVKRERMYRTLEQRVGLAPASILAARRTRLLDVCGGAGRFATQCVEKLEVAAQRVADEHDGDLSNVLVLPVAKSKQALMKFRGIGEPGAEKILLFTHAHPFLALDSNGVRVLTRLGFVEEQKSYSATYRAVKAAASATIVNTCEARIEAYTLLRDHGKTVCRRSGAAVMGCPLEAWCGRHASAALELIAIRETK